MQKLRIGATYHFTPTGFAGDGFGTGARSNGGQLSAVTGRIISVNTAHRHFTVEYEIHGHKLREAIKY